MGTVRTAGAASVDLANNANADRGTEIVQGIVQEIAQARVRESVDGNPGAKPRTAATASGFASRIDAPIVSAPLTDPAIAIEIDSVNAAARNAKSDAPTIAATAAKRDATGAKTIAAQTGRPIAATPIGMVVALTAAQTAVPITATPTATADATNDTLTATAIVVGRTGISRSAATLTETNAAITGGRSDERIIAAIIAAPTDATVTAINTAAIAQAVTPIRAIIAVDIIVMATVLAMDTAITARCTIFSIITPAMTPSVGSM